MENLIISELSPDDPEVEIVERKGLGHPDTICDALAETFSRNLCRAYRDRFGEIAHHNVDKALLCGGRAAPAFGGGDVIAPIRIYFAGRAVGDFGGSTIPVTDIAIEGSRAWLRANLHALDVERDVRIEALVEPGAQDLQHLFSRRREGPLANDTSFGVGYAPMSALERLVLAIESRITGVHRVQQNPAWGEDVKIMGVRRDSSVQLTVACAMIGRYLACVEEYIAEKVKIENLVQELALAHGFANCDVAVNFADKELEGSVYLTVTGTSAEAGDDGQVGRGNRVNGLITPGRPMSLEAAAGKNPVTHVGKIYNIVAREVAETLVAELHDVAAAECLIVSRIGAPVTRPAVVHMRLATSNGAGIVRFRSRAEEIATAYLVGIPARTDDFVSGKIEVF